jgi:hypothetical protein
MTRTTVLLVLLGFSAGLVVGGLIGSLGIWIGACGGVGMIIGLLLSRRRTRPAEPPEQPQ